MPCGKSFSRHKPEQQFCPTTGKIKGCCNCCHSSSFGARAAPTFDLDDFQCRDGRPAIRIQSFIGGPPPGSEQEGETPGELHSEVDSDLCEPIQFWSEGTKFIGLTPGSAQIQLEAENLYTVEGTPVDPPPAPNRVFGAIDVTRNFLFKWNPTTQVWFQVNGYSGISGINTDIFVGKTGTVAVGEGLFGDCNTRLGTDTLMNNVSNGNVAIGHSALKNQNASDPLASNNIAIGKEASLFNIEGADNVAIGALSRKNVTNSDRSVAIGTYSGYNNQGSDCIAIGQEAGFSDQDDFAIAIGRRAGFSGQGAASIAIGAGSGSIYQGNDSVAVGNAAGFENQQNEAIAIGNSAGFGTSTTDNANTVLDAFNFDEPLLDSPGQGSRSIAIGTGAGFIDQNVNCVAIGSGAGCLEQGGESIAIGKTAGFSGQGSRNIAIGSEAGKEMQSANSVAIGFTAGESMQGENSVAIGIEAGRNNQGNNCIAIGGGAAIDDQHDNTIVLNAKGTSPLNTTQTDSLFITPIRGDNDTGNGLRYNSDTGEITFAESKTFVIDHPTKQDNYLVHACLEGPEAGVYYRGESRIVDKSVEISLPEYVKSLAKDFTVHLTPIYEGVERGTSLMASKVKNGKFTVYGDKGGFSWVVYGKRGDVDVEPRKESVNVKGDGPYKYI